jgi:acyl-CoA dehydrogenase
LSAPTNSALSGHHRADYVSDLATYRHDFRQHLRKLDVADEWRAAAFTSAEDGLAHDAIVMARLNADGWNRFGWPEAAGGLGGNEIHRRCTTRNSGRR